MEDLSILNNQEDLQAWLDEYSHLSKEYQAIAEPKKAQIKSLEEEIAKETAHLTFQMETLEVLMRPVILAAKQNQKCPYFTAVYVERSKWNDGMLRTMAQEIPALMQAWEDGSYVQFRKTGR